MASECSDSDDEWILSLCRPRQDAHKCAEEAEDDKWLAELLSSHRRPDALVPKVAVLAVLSHPDGYQRTKAIEPIASSKRLWAALPLDDDPRPPPRKRQQATSSADSCWGYADRQPPELAAPALQTGNPCEIHVTNLVMFPLPSPPLPLPKQNSVIKWNGWHGDADVSTLDRCVWRWGGWMVAMSFIGVFKIGIAFDPIDRWSKADFCYMCEKTWMFMDVIHAGSADDCRQLERNLISKLTCVSGCHNIAPGGEGVSSATCGQYHVYIVYAPVGHGMSLRHAWVLRQRAGLVSGQERGRENYTLAQQRVKTRF